MEITPEILNRKGATKLSLVSDEVKSLLDKGLIASVNLTEWLATDHKALIRNVLPQEYQKACLDAINELKQSTAMKNIPAVAEALFRLGVHSKSDLFDRLSKHTSDSVRCWASYVVGIENMAIPDRLKAIKPFAADDNFGVREIAWMAVRADITTNLDESISILSTWTSDADTNVRRFASEATRPRGVWCKHIDELKNNPAKGLTILEPLKSDKEKYVRDSVANWLNDASKTQPVFVKDLCDKWSKESETKETAYIVKKALRSL